MEKRNIFLPEKTAQLLESDARQFEIFKKNQHAVNMTRFLSLLIAGYYSSYVEQYHQLQEQITGILPSNGMENPKACQASASTVIKTAIFPDAPKRKGVISRKISLKPTALTEPILLYLETVLDDDTVSQYFCRMFTAYTKNPVHVREQIIFKATYDSLQRACKKKQPIAFVTTRKPETVHEVLPYSLCVGKDSLFNYLLCQEQNSETGRTEAATYRISRITKLRQTSAVYFPQDSVQKHLQMMELYGPQYAINDDEETCVRFTEEGTNQFHRIHFGRPVPDRIETKSDGFYYYFKCSKNQLYLYFRRFDANHAVVISPKNLREQILDYHKQSVEAYSE